MPLFKTYTEISQYISISNASAGSALPKQKPAEEAYIRPVLGDTLFDSLQAEVDGTITHEDLLDKVRFALAYLMYYKELPLMHAIITETGLRNVTTDKVQGAYRYQYEETRQHLENEGLAALERLYEFLMENVADYPDWQSSEAYTRLNNNLIKTGTEFKKYYHLFQPHRTFHALQPVMQEVEDLFIKSIMDDVFFVYLRDVASPTTEESTVIELLKKAVANLTIYKAITKLSLAVRPEGVTVLLASNERSPAFEAAAGNQAMETLRQDTFRDGNTYLSRAQTYLNANASASIFATYFSSDYYTDPTITAEDPNDCSSIYAF